ncbi:MAG TPA: hypothetical protein GXX29_09980 [Firmicutes bacterium]|nr:hypothetical protein [Bacillota bacterium]
MSESTLEQDFAEKSAELEAAFADLIKELSGELARNTVEPALSAMHARWREEAGELRKATAEWIARVNTSRQHLENILDRQHELTQEVYATHSRLLAEMAAFQKERRDQLAWQSQVDRHLSQLEEHYKELSVESTRLTGVVRNIISELARYQAQLEQNAGKLLSEIKNHSEGQTTLVQDALAARAGELTKAIETQSKLAEETRAALSQRLSDLRSEVQAAGAGIKKDLGESTTFLRQAGERQIAAMEERWRKALRTNTIIVVLGEVLLAGGLLYLITRL